MTPVYCAECGLNLAGGPPGPGAPMGKRWADLEPQFKEWEAMVIRLRKKYRSPGCPGCST